MNLYIFTIIIQTKSMYFFRTHPDMHAPSETHTGSCISDPKYAPGKRLLLSTNYWHLDVERDTHANRFHYR